MNQLISYLKKINPVNDRGKKDRPNYFDFDNHFLDLRALFMNTFKKIPNRYFIRNADATQCNTYLNEHFGHWIIERYEKTFYSWEDKENKVDETVIVLSNESIINIDHEYVTVLFCDHAFGEQLKSVLYTFKQADKEKDFEINIITQESYGLDLKPMAIHPTQLDIPLFYNDDFIPVHETILHRLEQENDKGIVLLHGLPGTGKTTYLRYLIGSIKKKVLFVSPGVASSITNPEFLDLLIDNPNSVLIIEDAEHIIQDRRYTSNSSVSNLLNISDGLLSDFLNVQLVCTFNCDLNYIDQALLRKGRLIAKYEFGKLETTKAQALSEHLGMDTSIVKPMTLSEITNQHESGTEEVKPQAVIGFRRMNEFIN